MYEVLLVPAAAKFYAGVHGLVAKKLARCFERLTITPRLGNNIKPLAGEFEGYLRYRVGDYRVIYRIDEAGRIVLVVRIAHRRDVYE